MVRTLHGALIKQRAVADAMKMTPEALLAKCFTQVLHHSAFLMKVLKLLLERFEAHFDPGG